MLSVAATQENATMSYSVNIRLTSGTIEGAAVSMLTLGMLELDVALEFVLDFDVNDELFDDVADAWLELEELRGAVELKAGLELLASLLVTILSDEEVCGLVLVLLLAVKPLPPAPVPPPPPQALKSEITVAATRVVILGNLKLLIGHYLLHATAIDEMGLRRLDP
jgi:hypothetical protein